MSVQFQQQPQQVVRLNVEPRDDENDDDRQRLQSPGSRVPLDRMTSRLNPYSGVQKQLTQVQVDISREERADRIRIRRIFDKVRHIYVMWTMSNKNDNNDESVEDNNFSNVVKYSLIFSLTQITMDF